MYRGGFGQRLAIFREFSSIIISKGQSSSRGFSSSCSTKQVGTHNGSFHCDEALGCFLIRLTKTFSGARILRTRNPQAVDAIDNGIKSI